MHADLERAVLYGSTVARRGLLAMAGVFMLLLAGDPICRGLARRAKADFLHRPDNWIAQCRLICCCQGISICLGDIAYKAWV